MTSVEGNTFIIRGNCLPEEADLIVLADLHVGPSSPQYRNQMSTFVEETRKKRAEKTTSASKAVFAVESVAIGKSCSDDFLAVPYIAKKGFGDNLTIIGWDDPETVEQLRKIESPISDYAKALIAFQKCMQQTIATGNPDLSFLESENGAFHQWITLCPENIKKQAEQLKKELIELFTIATSKTLSKEARSKARIDIARVLTEKIINPVASTFLPTISLITRLGLQSFEKRQASLKKFIATCSKGFGNATVHIFAGGAHLIKHTNSTTPSESIESLLSGHKYVIFFPKPSIREADRDKIVAQFKAIQAAGEKPAASEKPETKTEKKTIGS